MYKLYSDNIITKGYARDLLIDFGRDQMTFLTKEITCFIESLSKGERKFSKEEAELIDELIKREIIFEIDSDEANLFPELNLEWDFPATITNSVIEVNESSILVLKRIVDELETLNCFYYSIVITENLSDKSIEVLQDLLTNSSIICFELTINYFQSEKLNDFIKELTETPRLKNKIKIFNCKDLSFLNLFKDYIIVRNDVLSNKCCGCINQENFNINLYLFTESQYHNTCLNRKVSIDALGNIRNCPNMKESFGNIKNVKIERAINEPDFRKYWNVKKDDIKICKDCEFRHICTDCRAFVENPEDVYSKPLKCGYSPYTGKWEEWSVNPLKQKAIEHYEMKHFVK